MSNRTLDRYMESEYLRDEYACCECGYRRGLGNHPGVKCPKTGRCGSCGNDWPCKEHAPHRRIKEIVTDKKRAGQHRKTSPQTST